MGPILAAVLLLAAGLSHAYADDAPPATACSAYDVQSGLRLPGQHFAGWSPTNGTAYVDQSGIAPSQQGLQLPTFADCSCQCANTSQCVAFTYLNDSQECWLHDWVDWSSPLDEDNTASIGRVPALPASQPDLPSNCTQVAGSEQPDAVACVPSVEQDLLYVIMLFGQEADWWHCNLRCLAEPTCVLSSVQPLPPGDGGLQQLGCSLWNGTTCDSSSTDIGDRLFRYVRRTCLSPSCNLTATASPPAVATPPAGQVPALQPSPNPSPQQPPSPAPSSPPCPAPPPAGSKQGPPPPPPPDVSQSPHAYTAPEAGSGLRSPGPSSTAQSPPQCSPPAASFITTPSPSNPPPATDSTSSTGQSPQPAGGTSSSTTQPRPDNATSPGTTPTPSSSPVQSSAPVLAPASQSLVRCMLMTGALALAALLFSGALQ